ncbi:MAG: hypothetical protein K1X79_03785 [Oligoflexia bacterium]|nr:hypothetical protein [Oligoflexia bacterium]
MLLVDRTTDLVDPLPHKSPDDFTSDMPTACQVESLALVSCTTIGSAVSWHALCTPKDARLKLFSDGAILNRGISDMRKLLSTLLISTCLATPTLSFADYSEDLSCLKCCHYFITWYCIPDTLGNRVALGTCEKGDAAGGTGNQNALMCLKKLAGPNVATEEGQECNDIMLQLFSCQQIAETDAKIKAKQLSTAFHAICRAYVDSTEVIPLCS